MLDSSHCTKLSEVVEIELSGDEDSVTSLGITHAGENKAHGAIVALAGINSSEADLAKGINEHLRSFRLEYPFRKKVVVGPVKSENNGTMEGKDETTQEVVEEEVKPPTTMPVGKTSFFRLGPHKPGVPPETYQKTLRLSQWRGEDKPRIALIATGMEPQGELVVFSTASEAPQHSDILARLRLENGSEVEDADIISLDAPEEGNFKVAFTDGKALRTFHISATGKAAGVPDTETVYSISLPPPRKKGSRIRGLRFLTSTAFVLLQNFTDRSGCELLLVSEGIVQSRRRLPAAMKIGLGLDICVLSASQTGIYQTAIAVSGSNHSIELFTIDHILSAKQPFSQFRPYVSLPSIHSFTITKLAFSPFPLLKDWPLSPLSDHNKRPHAIKLATVSIGNTVAVHTFPLSTSPDFSRYILAQSARRTPYVLETVLSGTFALLVIVLVAFFLQAFSEIRGAAPPLLGAPEWLSPRLRGLVARPYYTSGGVPVSSDGPVPTLEVGIPSTTERESAVLGTIAEISQANVGEEDNTGADANNDLPVSSNTEAVNGQATSN